MDLYSLFKMKLTFCKALLICWSIYGFCREITMFSAGPKIGSPTPQSLTFASWWPWMNEVSPPLHFASLCFILLSSSLRFGPKQTLMTRPEQLESQNYGCLPRSALRRSVVSSLNDTWRHMGRSYGLLWPPLHLL